MKVRMALLFLIAVLMLLGPVVFAQHGGQGAVEAGTASGGNYQLTSLTWQVSGSASGGHYQLLCPASTTGNGSGCCCTYLPAVLRSYK